MDNNRFFRNTRTNFENDLQDILTNYLNENMDDILNETNNIDTNNNNENTDDILNNNNNGSNINNYVHSNYYILNRILDGLSANMNAYHRNYREYLSLLREIITTLPDNQINTNTTTNTNVNTNVLT